MSMKSKRKSDSKDRIIKKYVEEIESLKARIVELEIERDDKDEVIKSIDVYRNELKNTIADLKKKRDEYDKLNSDLMQMRKIFNEEVFRGRWNIIKLLMK